MKHLYLSGLLLATALLTGPVPPPPPVAAPPAPTAPWRPLAPGRLPAAHRAAPGPADTSAAGLAPVLADLRRRAYFLEAARSDAPAARQAANPAQRLTARLAAASYAVATAAVPPARAGQPVRPAPVNAAGPAWQVGFRLRGIGRGRQLAWRPAARPTLAAATDTSVRYQHGAAFAVEYTNTPAGVRQNYYLARRPVGSAGPVRVALTLATTLRPTLAADGQALSFAPAGGGAAVLRYAGLWAWDATGRALSARLRLTGATALALEVDDVGARYPLTIDPLVSTPTTRLNDPSNSDFASFGYSVAGAGDVNGDGYSDVVVGASGTGNGGSGRGSAYLYYGSATGLGTSPGTTSGTYQRLNDPVNVNQDYFALRATGAGDVNGDGYADVIIGAYGTANGGTRRGSAYLYLGSATGLGTAAGTTAGTVQRLNNPDNTDSDNFGYSVAGAGDVNGDGYADVLVGATGGSNGSGRGGCTYTYLGSATGLGASPGTTAGTYQRLSASGASSFGYSVAGAGDVNGDGYADVVVGAYGTVNGPSTDGSAYVYLGSATGLGTTAGTTAGTAQRFNDPDNTDNDGFGFSVAGAGDVNGDGYADVVIGAVNTDDGANHLGSTFLYYGSAAGLGASPGTTAGTVQRLNNPLSTTENSNGFGHSVTGTGDVNGDGYADVVIGADVYSGAVLAGYAYVYYGSAGGLGTMAGTTAGTYQRLNDPVVPVGYDYFGSAVGGAGDVNGDGYADVLVGDYSAANGGNARGSAYLYLGSPGPLLTSPSRTFADPATTDNDRYGDQVAGVGDVNGDGYGDVLVGALGTSGQGSVYLYYGSATGPGTASGTGAGQVQRLNDPAATGNDAFGASVAGAGDVNGDGYADVLVGAYGTANGGSYRGSAYVYYGSATGLGTAAGSGAGQVQRLNDPDNTNSDYFGRDVSGAGDLNGDGYADVAIGVPGAANGGSSRGSCYVHYGSASGLGTTPGTSAGTVQRLDDPNNHDFDSFGRNVAGAGDVNGDGYPDLLVGAYDTSLATGGKGSVYLYYGAPAGLGTASGTAAGQVQRLDDPDTHGIALFGAALAGAGDVNGDGYADVVIGADQTPNGGSYRGSAYVYYGSPTGLGTAPGPGAGQGQRFNDPDNRNADHFGGSVAGAGDVNGDGYADVLVGADQTLNPDGSRGSAFVLLGSAGGLSLAAGTTAGTSQRPTSPTIGSYEAFAHVLTGAGDVNGDGYADVLVGAPYAANGGSYRGSVYYYPGNQGDARPGGAIQLFNAALTAPLAASNRAETQFGLVMTIRSVLGVTRGRVVWEVVAQGQPFSAGTTRTNSVLRSGNGAWRNLGTASTTFRSRVTKVGRTNQVRARIEYASATLAGASPAGGTGGVGGAPRYGPWQYASSQQLAQLNALPLPVQLVAFAAQPAGPAAVRLTWTTASEASSARFDIERSPDGRAWAAVGQVAAAGSSASARSYGFTDAAAPAGLLYYRLRLVDTDGSGSYSPVRTVVLGAVGLALYPNPSTGAATLTGAAPGQAVEVLDVLGRLIATAATDASGTAALGGLAPGLYVVRAGPATARLLVQ